MSVTLNFDEAVALGLPELHKRKEELQNEEQIDPNLWNVINNAISHLEAEQEQKEAVEERKQEIEEQKSSIKLPHDYNEKFGDDRANEEIKLLIQQAYDQVWEYAEIKLAEKDAENREAIQRLHSAYEVDMAKVRGELQEQKDMYDSGKVEYDLLKEEFDRLQKEFQLINTAANEWERQNNEGKSENSRLKLQLSDAEQKRDAAMREVDSLKAQIIELEQMTAKPKKAVFSLNLTSTIEDKPIGNSRDAALRRAEELYGVTPPVIGGEPNGESFQEENSDSSESPSNVQLDGSAPVDAEVQGEAIETFQVQDVQSTEGRDTVHEAVEGTSTFDAEAAVEELRKRVERLERHANLPWAV